MARHWERPTCFIVGEGEFDEPPFFPHEELPQPPSTSPTDPPVGGSGGSNGHRHARPVPQFPFGRMFGKRKSGEVKLSDAERDEMVAVLVALSKEMLAPTDKQKDDSSIAAGYTYLGQYIAHEVTFDKNPDPLGGPVAAASERSPQIDLDSLYGRGPKEQPEFYQDSARLKIGETIAGPNLRKTFFNDLPRQGFGREDAGRALIPDPRNDENLLVAQTHVALIKFHNKVVDQLHTDGCPEDELFERARKDVVQHFQSIILHDFLPKLFQKEPECLRTAELKYFDISNRARLFMPLEFSVAAFRFGHSMVRDQYELNIIHGSEPPFGVGPAKLAHFFMFTKGSGNLNGKPRLESEWIINWRRFYDFAGAEVPGPEINKARRIDTTFSLRIENIPGFPHAAHDVDHQSIVARNLLRGFSFNLISGEEACEATKTPCLKPEQIGLTSPRLKGNTPLWYYILKEAEFNDGKLGPLASCIIAETLVGLIKMSPYSIFKEPNWRPKYSRFNADPEKYRMIDLLRYAEVVDPLGNLKFS